MEFLYHIKSFLKEITDQYVLILVVGFINFLRISNDISPSLPVLISQFNWP